MSEIKRSLNHHIGEDKFKPRMKKRILMNVKYPKKEKPRSKLIYSFALVSVLFIAIVLLYDAIPIKNMFTSNSGGPAHLANGHNNNEDDDQLVVPNEVNSLTEAEIMEAKDKLVERTGEILNALKEHNFEQLASFVRDGDSLLFSFTPDVSFMPVEIPQDELAYFTGDEVYLWGKDLDNQKFEMPISEYIDEQLMRNDYFVNNYNEFHPVGLEPNTIHDHYPNAVYIEYHSPIIEQKSRPWKKLRFVYEYVDDEWWLIGIVREYPGDWDTNSLNEAEVMKAKDELIERTKETFHALKEHNFEQLASFVHDDSYLFITFTADVSSMPVVIEKRELASFTGDEVYSWGMDPAAEQKFEMSILDYIDDYLVRDDYSYSNYNESTPTGLTINTIHDYYPDAVFVEYHSPEIVTTSELIRTWRMLRFVYEYIDGQWWLIGIVRDDYANA